MKSEAIKSSPVEQMKNSFDGDEHLLNRKMGNIALSNNHEEADDSENFNNYLTTYAFAQRNGVTFNTVEKKKKQLGIVGTPYQNSSGKTVFLLSPEEQSKISDILPKEAPENYCTVVDFADSLDRSIDTVRLQMKELGVDGKLFKGKRGKPSIYLSPEEQGKIMNNQPKRVSEEKRNDYCTVSDFASNILHVSRNNLYKRMGKLGIKGTKFRGRGGQEVTYLSIDEQEKILNSIPKEAPKEYKTISEVANEAHVVPDTIREAMKKIGIEGDVFKGRLGEKPTTFLSPVDKQSVLDSLLKEAPKNCLTPYDFALKIGRDRKTIFRKIEELNIDLELYLDKSKKKRAPYLSLVHQEQIIKSLSDEEPPSNYLTINDFSAQIGLDSTTIRGYVRDLRIDDSIKYKSKDKPGVRSFYLSPEQQRDIIEFAEKRNSGSSIPENAIAFYLSQEGKKVRQNYRPDWLKNPNTGRNLEIDIFVDPPGIGIEYDGYYYHQDVERDLKKDILAREHGCHIIHIREEGCPELSETSICINRKNNRDDNDLTECIKQCLLLLEFQGLDIDVSRDKKEILDYIGRKMSKKIRTGERLEDTSPAA